MPVTASLPIKDAHGRLDMELVLIDDATLLLRGAEHLEEDIQEAEERAAQDSDDSLISRLLRLLASHEFEETERAIERLAAGVPLSLVEEMGLDSSGFKIRFKGHGRPLIHLDLNAIDWAGACTFAGQVESAQEQLEQLEQTG